MTFSKSLPRQEVNEIGRRFCSDFGFPGLGIKMISASFHSGGMDPPIFQTVSLKSCVSFSKASVPRFLIMAFVIRSGPGAVFLLKDSAAAYTSADDIGSSRVGLAGPD